jgi:hypothetical protein
MHTRSKPAPHKAIARIASHQPLNVVTSATINLLTHPYLLTLGGFVALASIANALEFGGDRAIPPMAIAYLLAGLPAGWLLHYLTSGCSIDEMRVLSKVANEDPLAGPFVRAWLAADQTPSTTEVLLVRRYLALKR